MFHNIVFIYMLIYSRFKMKFLFLCKQSCANLSDIKIVKEYTKYINEDEKISKDIEETILNYISEDLGEGKKHTSIAIQTEKTPEEINNDESLPIDHHYVRLENGVYYLYQKYKIETEVSEGWLFTSTVKKVVTSGISKICAFIVMQHNLELYNYIPHCVCNEINKDSTKKSIESQSNLTFVEQMRSIFANLKSSDNMGIVQISSLDFGKDGITKYRASSFRKQLPINDGETKQESNNKISDNWCDPLVTSN